MASPIFLNNLRKVVTGTLVGASYCLDVNIPAGTAITAITAQNLSGSNVDSTVSSAVTVTAPANAQGFILMNLDTSTQNIRWKIGGVAGAASGSQLQPGRDTGYIPCGANVSICAESGTQNYNLQWVMSS